MTTLAIDIETYSDVDIKFGVHRYVDTPNFEILLFGYSFDDEPVSVVDLTTTEVPDRVRQALFDSGVTKTAFNANFEITCLRKLYPDMPDESWECSSVLALYNSLPTGLANVAKILRLGDDKQKDTRGLTLIRYFSIPCKPTKTNGGRTRNMPIDAPDKWQEFIEYCRQDVAVEKAIRKRLISMRPPEAEHKLWLLDRKINDMGCLVDKNLVQNAIRIYDEYTVKLFSEAQRLTNLENPNSVTQLLDWLESRLGTRLQSIDKAAVAELLAGDLPNDVRRMLHIRQLLGKTSVKKYQAMQHCATQHGRIHDLFQFYGANRTGRWAGRNVQLQNLPRNSMPDLDDARQLVLDGDLETLELLYDSVPDALSQLVRTALIPTPGNRFIVADFSAIEARVIAWLAKEQWRMGVFADGGDIYCASASAMFHVPVVKHGENGHLRQKGKVAELALGYGGGPGALVAMGALSQGLAEDELPEIVHKWRKASPAITKFWYDAEAAAIQTVKTGRTHRLRQCDVTFASSKGALVITLPSKRQLVYIHPKIEINRFGRDSVTYVGTEQGSGKWTRLETYGGKLVENIVQAVARDCLAAAMTRLDTAGYNIVAHIHDEVLLDMPQGTGSLADVCRIMSQNEPWNDGLIMNADGFESNYYKKD